MVIIKGGIFFMIPRHEYDKRELIDLQKSISIPSEVHGYSLGVEYMRDWILNKFPDNFFKTILRIKEIFLWIQN